MSFKVYHGRILRKTSLEGALTKAKALRERCLEPALDAVAKEAAQHLAFLADLQVNGFTVDLRSLGFKTLMRTLQDAKKKVDGEGIRSTRWDHTFDLAFIPWKEDILVLFFMENDPGYSAAMADLGFEDYHYQNSVDRPESIDEAEWLERYEAWHGCGYLQYEAPAHIGFSFQVVGWRDLLDVAIDQERIRQQALDPLRRQKAVAAELITPEIKDWGKGKNLGYMALANKARELIEAKAPDIQLAEDYMIVNHLF